MELKDTLTQMLSDDYKERFKAEYCQLLIRVEKLANVIDGYYTGQLDFKLNCPVLLLEKQFSAMRDYLVILDIRAEIEGIDLSQCIEPAPQPMQEMSNEPLPYDFVPYEDVEVPDDMTEQ